MGISASACINIDTASISMIQSNNIIYIRISGQQLFLDFFDNVIGDPGDTLYANSDAEDIFGSYSTIGIGVTMECITALKAEVEAEAEV